MKGQDLSFQVDKLVVRKEGDPMSTLFLWSFFVLVAEEGIASLPGIGNAFLA